MDRSGILFGCGYVALGLWALDDSVWLATGFFVMAALYVTTSFSRRAHDFLHAPLVRRRGGGG